MRPASLQHFKWNIILVTNDSVPSNDHIKWQADDRDNPPQYSSIALLTDNTHGLVIREVDLYGHCEFVLISRSNLTVIPIYHSHNIGYV